VISTYFEEIRANLERAEQSVHAAKELVGKGYYDFAGSTEKLSKEQGKNLNWLFELRSIGDYGGVVHVSEEQAKQAVCFAENFLEAVRRLIQEVQFQLSIPSNP